jgi:hypothetical protein
MLATISCSGDGTGEEERDCGGGRWEGEIA